MATEEEAKSAQERVQSLKAVVLAFDFKPLVRSDLGVLSFAQVEARFEFLRGRLTRIDDAVIGLLPWKTLSELNDHLTAMVNFLNEAAAFRLDDQMPGRSPVGQRRDELIERFTRAYDLLLPALWAPSLHSTIEGSRLEETVASGRWATVQAKEAEERLAQIHGRANEVLKTPESVNDFETATVRNL